MIAIVDYGLGNVRAIANIYERLGLDARIASDATALEGASKAILPGVGAFDWAITRFAQSGMREALERRVRAGACSVLGICVGMQMLADRSEEGQLPGLGWIAGTVRRFGNDRVVGGTHLPHMGWNDVVPTGESDLLAGLAAGARFYFLHSYHFDPANASDTLATSDYGGDFVCAVGRGRVFGVQFHPEKSHQWGVRLLRNFAELRT